MTRLSNAARSYTLDSVAEYETPASLHTKIRSILHTLSGDSEVWGQLSECILRKSMMELSAPSSLR